MVARLCKYHAQAIRHFRHLLTTALAHALSCSLILSGIDYCDAVLHGTQSYSIKKLQWVQNNSARIVLKAPRWSHASPLLRMLHWLSIQQRIDYRVGLLTFKVCSTSMPLYRCCLIQNLEHSHYYDSACIHVDAFGHTPTCHSCLAVAAASASSQASQNLCKYFLTVFLQLVLGRLVPVLNTGTSKNIACYGTHWWSICITIPSQCSLLSISLFSILRFFTLYFH